MKLVDLLDKASEGYPDTRLYYTRKGKLIRKNLGDGLAKFIVAELIETFDPEKSDDLQLSTAIRVTGRAIEDLGEIKQELLERREMKKGDVVRLETARIKGMPGKIVECDVTLMEDVCEGSTVRTVVVESKIIGRQIVRIKDLREKEKKKRNK